MLKYFSIDGIMGKDPEGRKVKKNGDAEMKKTKGFLALVLAAVLAVSGAAAAGKEDETGTREPDRVLYNGGEGPAAGPNAGLMEIPTPEPASETPEKPAPEATAAPTVEPAPEPTAEPAAEPTEEPAEEPALTAEEIADRAFERLEAGAYDEAIPLLFEAAGDGSARALSGLGYCYYRGFGVEENDAEAAKWFRLAARQGVADAQYYLGMCLYYGWGTAQDDAEAADWFRKAAEQGDARGQYYLGNCIYLGRGAERDEAEAVKWFRLSAEQGYARAMYSLGYMLYTGTGTVKDEAAAKEWIRKALDAGVKLNEEEQARAEELLGGEDAQ